jgi:hypothetical protein
MVAVLSFAPPAQATTYPVNCTNLTTYLSSGGPVVDGDVVQLSGICNNLSFLITNTSAFTLQGDPNTPSGFNGGQASSSILNSSAPVRLTIKNLSFTNGTQTTQNGGAVEITNAGAAPTIISDTFTGNHSGAGYCGGAVWIQTNVATSTQLTTIDRDTFRNNASACGGAVEYEGNGAVSVTNSTFTGSRSTVSGGAVMIRNTAASSTNPITLSGNTIGGAAAGAGNGAVVEGGGAYVFAYGQPVAVTGNAFVDNTLSGTSASDDRVGGGLAVLTTSSSPGTVTQSDNVFSGNQITSSTTAMTLPPPGAGGGGEWLAGITGTSVRDQFIGNRVATTGGAVPEGGGLGIEGNTASAPATLTATDDLFLANSVEAGGWGGGIYSGYFTSCTSPDCPSHLTLKDSTVSGNSVDAGGGSEGGAIWGSSDDTLAVSNSIVFGNPSGAGQPDVFGFSAPSFQYSDACTTPGAATPVGGTGNICANPNLNANGSESASSPTLDLGSNALVPAGLTTDVFGNARIVAGRCGDAAIVDMGAAELPTLSCPAGGGTTPPPISTQGTATTGGVTVSFNSVTVAVGCKGTALQICDGDGSLFTTEHLLGSKLVSLSAKRKRKHTRQVLVGRKHFTLHAGQSVKLKIPLNATGKRLLRRLGKLPARLVVTVNTSRGKVTITTRHITIKPKRKKRRH